MPGPESPHRGRAEPRLGRAPGRGRLAGMSDDAKRLVALLRAESPQVRIAAAIVVGELELRAAGAVEALLEMAETGLVPLQTHALDALARVGAGTATERLFPFLQDPHEEVRAAAARALAASGGKQALGALLAELA